MTINEIEFHRQFYLWSVADWQREINQGFPYLGTLSNNTLRNILNELHCNEVKDFTTAMVKRSMKPEILDKLGLEISKKDQYYTKLYVEKWNASFLTDPLYKKFDRAASDKINPLAFKECINKELAPLLGIDFDDIEGWKVWQYVNEVGPWKIKTTIEIGNTHHQLSYAQSVFFDKKNYLLKHYSILRWLGLSAGTEWDGLKNSDVPFISKTLANLINHFIKSMLILLGGNKRAN